MSADPFDEAMSLLDPPMVVVTATHGGERAGCLVGFHCQSSIEPRRYCVWISRVNHSAGVVPHAATVAVHFLGTEDHDLAVLFGSETGDEVDKFARCDVTDHRLGPPVLARCRLRAIMGRVDVCERGGGDHIGVLLDPIEVSGGPGLTPLRLSDVRDVEPGHPTD